MICSQILLILRGVLCTQLMINATVEDAGTTKPAVEATSLLGKSLVRPDIPPDRRAKLENDLVKAKVEFDAQPNSEDAAIWYGRRLAYLGRYRDAIEVFSVAIEKHPQSYKLLRHRGHRYITVREFDKAIADLTRAAELARGVPDEIEPDGAPNPKNIPRSTNQSNIWYHLALAHYLKGDFKSAAEGWTRCVEFSLVNDDMLVATMYWQYVALRRAGKHEDAIVMLAPIRPEMDIIENHAYHRLLLLFRGDLGELQVRDGAGDDAIADATIGYGLGVWKLINGDSQGARIALEKVMQGSNWAPFGYIAAEAELARKK